MLGISCTYEALYCSAYGRCAVECSVACCAAQHTAVATLTGHMTYWAGSGLVYCRAPVLHTLYAYTHLHDTAQWGSLGAT